MGTPEYNRAPEIIKEHKRIHAVNNSIEAPPNAPRGGNLTGLRRPDLYRLPS